MIQEGPTHMPNAMGPWGAAMPTLSDTARRPISTNSEGTVSTGRDGPGDSKGKQDDFGVCGKKVASTMTRKQG